MSWFETKRGRLHAAVAGLIGAFLVIGVTAGLTSASWWPGDSAIKDVLSGYDAELVGGATYASGRISRAFSFPSAGSAVKLPGEVLDGYGDVSFEAWMSTQDTQATIFSAANSGQPNELALDVTGTNTLRFSSRGSSFQLTATGIASGDFHHIVWVRESSGSNRLYVDGALVGSGSLPTGDLSVDDDGLYLAQRQTAVGTFDAAQQFVGLLDEVAIYAQALNARQVASRYAITRRDRLEEQANLRNQILNNKADELEVLVETRAAELTSLLNTRAAELTSLINTRADSLDTSVASNYDLVFNTHQVDPFDMTLDICGNVHVGAALGVGGQFGGGGGAEGKAGADIYGTGAQAKAKGKLEVGVSGHVGGEAGLEATACVNPLIVRQSDTASGLATVRQEMLTALETLGLLASDNLPALAADVNAGTAPAQTKLKAASSGISTVNVGGIEPLNPLQPFANLANALPLPAGVKTVFDNPTSIVPLSLMPTSASDLDKLCDSAGSFPFTIVNDICAMASTLGPQQALTAVQNLNAAVNNITSIQGTVNSISSSVGTNIKGDVSSIKGTVEDIQGTVDDICDAVDDIEGVSC